MPNNYEERIEKLISEMTLEEKLGQLTQEYTTNDRIDELEKLAEKLSETAKERKAEMFVVGLPLNMDGSCGERGEKCKEFAKLLEGKSGLPVELSDERLTTVQAHNALNFTNTRGKKRHGVVDTVAAVMILENFLMKRKNR